MNIANNYVSILVYFRQLSFEVLHLNHYWHTMLASFFEFTEINMNNNYIIIFVWLSFKLLFLLYFQKIFHMIMILKSIWLIYLQGLQFINAEWIFLTSMLTYLFLQVFKITMFSLLDHKYILMLASLK